MSDPQRRRALMTAALGFSQIRWHEPQPPIARTLGRWLNSWSGLGAIVAGMTAQGFNLELREFPWGWRANFYPVGNAHSIVCGTGWETTPWKSVHTAAWEALSRLGCKGGEGENAR